MTLPPPMPDTVGNSDPESPRARNQSGGPIFLKSRLLSAAEVAAAAFFVFGYNVLHILPNEVPILFGLGLISYRLRNGGWAAMGLVQPTSWTRIVLVALAAAVARIVVGEGVDPLTARLWPPAGTPEDFTAIRGTTG